MYRFQHHLTLFAENGNKNMNKNDEDNLITCFLSPSLCGKMMEKKSE